jgi:hypothetical protein
MAANTQDSAFSLSVGYLTRCPRVLGTGIPNFGAVIKRRIIHGPQNLGSGTGLERSSPELDTPERVSDFGAFFDFICNMLGIRVLIVAIVVSGGLSVPADGPVQFDPQVCV